MISFSLRRTLSILAGFILISIGGLALYFWLEGPLGTNFHHVSSHYGPLYRSAQLDPEELTYYVNRHDIETVVNLRGKAPDAQWYQQERKTLNELNVKLINIRMKAKNYPTRHQLLQLIDVFLNKKLRPMLIHCYSGSDRTGLAAAVNHIVSTQRHPTAHQHLAFFPYGHISWGEKGRLDAFLDYYHNWKENGGGLWFKPWVKKKYGFTDPNRNPNNHHDE